MAGDVDLGNVSVYTTSRLLQSGRSPEQIRTLIRRGELVRIGKGIFVTGAVMRRMAGLPHGDHLIAVVAALALNRPAVVSHRSAALIYGIDLIGSTATVTVTARPSCSRRVRDGLHVYTTPMPAAHVAKRYGLPVTSPARTVIDLARTSPLADGVAAADSAIRKGLTSKSALRAVLADGTRRRGNAKAELVVELANGLAESPLESIARVAFRECGLPMPALQVGLPPYQRRIARVDFYWEEFKTIAEADGALKYEDPARARAQLWRDKKLREAGYEIVHFDWREITTTPAEVANSIRAAFRRGQRLSDPAA